jgi:hypothetical protein
MHRSMQCMHVACAYVAHSAKFEKYICNMCMSIYRNEFEMKLRLHYLEERLRACLDGDEPLQLHYANVDLRYTTKHVSIIIHIHTFTRISYWHLTYICDTLTITLCWYWCKVYYKRTSISLVSACVNSRMQPLTISLIWCIWMLWSLTNSQKLHIVQDEKQQCEKQTAQAHRAVDHFKTIIHKLKQVTLNF